MIWWVTLTILMGLAAVALVLAVRYYARTLYTGPWFLLLGPDDADRAALLSGARQTAVPRGVGSGARGAPGLSWHYFQSGAIVDVAGHLAFHDGDRETLGWERTLRLLRRYRPRRPVDGVILAIPATLFTGADWLSRAHEIGATIRDRLLQAQRYFGFALPVYVVVTQCESVRGFSAFARALPQALLRNMLGWSNPRPAHEPFAGEWIAEGFADLHRSIALAQVEIFATGSEVDADASDLLLFSRDVTRLMAPLRAVLEETFRPGLHQEAFFFRGFYLCGEGAPPAGVVDVIPPRTPALVAAPPGPIVFVSDLFEWKIFPERGLARPLPGRVRATRRALWAARAAVALLAIVLASGTVYAYANARHMRSAYAALFASGGALLEERRQLRRGERTLSDAERLAQSRRFLEQLQAVGPGRLGSPFMPASLVGSLDRHASSMVTDVFGEVVLYDLREALRRRAGSWLATEPPVIDPPRVIGPTLEDNPYYQRLERFAAEYEAVVGGVRQYEQLAAGQGPPDLSGASDLLTLLTGAPLVSTSVSPALGRAVRVARSDPFGCDVFEDAAGRGSLVGLRASRLLDEFGAASFGDEHPVLVASDAFLTDWMTVMEGSEDPGTVLNLMDATTDLSSAVAAWGSIGSRSQALAIPAIARPPFTPSPDDARICAALRPDLSAAMSRVVEQRDQLSARLLNLEVEPFGALVVVGDKGLVLGEGVGSFKADLDALGRESFWAPAPIDASATLPSNPTWRPDAFDDVTKVADAHDSFRARAFGGLPMSDRRQLLAAVRAEVARLVAWRLVVAAAAGGPPGADPQQRLDEITATGAQLGRAERLVPLLAADPFYGADVLRALDQQASRALQDIDRMAARQYPAIFGQQFDAVFTRWTDVQRGAAPAEALKQWAGVVDEQRDGTHHLAQLARPLVQFLSTRQRSDLVRRWSTVVADAADYDQKRPDNGLTRLDVTLRDVIPSIVPEEDCSIDGVGTLGGGNSYLSGVRKAIIDEAVRRCRAQVEERYVAVASAFNELLAGYVPFRRDTSAGAEATPAQVAEFLTMYERQAGSTLRRALEARGCTADVLSFIRGADSLAALLGGVRAVSPPAVTLDVLPEFRIDSPHDVGTDQIAQWRMEVGAHTFEEGVGGKPAPWTSGDPIAVALRFARDSSNRPVATTAGGRVQDRWVRFEFGGTWALLQLIRAGRTATREPEPEPGVLGFRILVERDPETPPLAAGPASSRFTASMRLRVYAPGKPEVLPADDLPTRAPVRLSCRGG